MISETIVKTKESYFNADDYTDPFFPVKREIFIPQAFKALQYKSEILLEAEETWDMDDQEEIGSFILDSLHHSVTGSRPLLILGGPGAGKTLLCQMLAAQIFSQEYHVIIINLRDTNARQTVVQQINEQIERDFSNKCVWDDISDPSMSKPILLIFDGYDELLQASGRTYSDYVAKIAAFQKEQWNYYGIQVKCIITSRITLIGKAVIPDGSIIMKLSDFDDSRIENWSAVWNEKNRFYFEKYQIEEFSVKEGSKVYDLAKQPLLLFMLALYDSSGNALKKNEDLSYAQLYDRLIRDFIAREQRKQAWFSSCTKDKRREMINTEMRKISIAALGMYNRRILYIRGEDLEKDLNYLMPSDGRDQRPEEPYETLKNSEKLLGSFFFIYRSVSREGNKNNALKASAYEFLHNTFGEFLTADYIVSQLYNILDYFTVLKEKNKIGSWSLKEEREWASCLSYALLSSRPMVVKMIREWAPACFQKEGLSGKAASDAMETLLKTEIGHVIGGEEIFSLNEVLSANGNPFRKQDLYLHLAYYSLNLIALGALACENIEDFFFDSKVWDRLARLWRLAIPEEELLDFAELFRTERENETCSLRYVAGTLDSYDSQKRILRIRRIAQSLGDNAMIALTSTILGRGDAKQVLQMIEENDLDISARYMRNRCLYGVSSEIVWNIPDDMALFLEYCLKKADPQDVIRYYRAVNGLVKRNIRNNDSLQTKLFYERLLARLCDTLDRIGRWIHDDTSRNTYIQMQNVIYNLLSLIPLSTKGWKELLNICISREHYQLYLRMIDRLTKEIRDRENPIFKELYSNEDFMDTACSCLSDIGGHDYNSGKAPYPARLIISILKALKISSTESLLGEIMQRMMYVLLDMGENWTIQQQVFAIDCLKFAGKVREEVDGWYNYLKRIISRISIKAVVDYSPSIAYDYCCFLKEELTIVKKKKEDGAFVQDSDEVDLFYPDSKPDYDLLEKLKNPLPNELAWLLNNKENDLTVKLYIIFNEVLGLFR